MSYLPQSSNPPVQRQLRWWLLGLRTRRLLQGLYRGLLLGCSISLMLALAARVFAFKTQADSRSLAWLITGVTILASTTGHFLYTPGLHARYRDIDRETGLQEALTTWHEIRTGVIPADAHWEMLLHNRILHSLKAKQPRQIIRWLPTIRQTITLGILAILTGLALWLPNPQDERVMLHELEEQALEQAEAIVEESLQAATVNDALTESEKAALLQSLEQALQALEAKDDQAGLQDEQAALLKALSDLEQLYDLQSAEKIADLRERASQLAEQTDSLYDVLDAMQNQDLQQALQALNDLDMQSLSDEERQSATDTLHEMAEMLDNQALSQSLETLAEALETMDSEALEQAMNELSKQVQELVDAQEMNAEIGEAQESLEQALQALDTTQNPAGNPFNATNLSQAHGIPDDGNKSHSEDSGADSPYGDEDNPRIDDTGGLVTLPRGEVDGGDPTLTSGATNSAEIPYSEVVGDYSDAARAQLDSGSYPPAMQSLIKAYFTDLEE